MAVAPLLTLTVDGADAVNDGGLEPIGLEVEEEDLFRVVHQSVHMQGMVSSSSPVTSNSQPCWSRTRFMTS